MTHEVDTYRSIFIVGLRDAYAVEHQALALIDRQLGRVVNYPELIDRLHAHRAETETPRSVYCAPAKDIEVARATFGMFRRN